MERRVSVIHIPLQFLIQIQESGEAAYPEEGAGFLLGQDGTEKSVLSTLPLPNIHEESGRKRRYLISPEDYIQAEATADRLGMSLIGVFHSHPDHSNRPSEYDRDWAQPAFSYVITSVNSGKAVESRSWKLSEDRSTFLEETIKS